MNAFPQKNINDESNVMDFALTDENEQGELLKNIKNLILSENESESACLRIWKFFNLPLKD